MVCGPAAWAGNMRTVADKRLSPDSPSSDPPKPRGARAAPAAEPGALRMRDVAAVAGVDTSVVSRVLSGDERLAVRPETRQRVLDTVARLGYRPNVAARALKTAQTMAIGMVIPDFSNLAYGEIARGAEQRAAEFGYIVLVASGNIEARLPMLEGRVDGLLYAIATSDEGRGNRLPERMPSLLVNRREPGLGPSIIGNDDDCAAVATQHLIDLGHKRIAHFVAELSVDTTRRRTAGYLRAMAEAGLPVVPSVPVASFDETGGYEAALALMSQTPRPTAIFAATARWAHGAMAALEELELSVPGDVSIVTLSDLPMARFTRPALTTVQLPLVTMGSRAAEMIIKLINGEEVEDAVVDDPPQLLVRSSSGPPPAES